MKKQAFTLIELIVVIAILAVLAAISYVSFQGHSKSARDSVRMTDISTLNSNFELYYLNTAFYPDPDAYSNVSYSGVLIWKQGIVGPSVRDTMSKIPVDPLFDTPYTYSVDANNQNYQIGGITETSRDVSR